LIELLNDYQNIVCKLAIILNFLDFATVI